MDKVVKPLLIVAGGLIAWNIFSRREAAASLNFIPGKIKGISWEGMSPVLTIQMIVQNTSNHSFTILSIAGNVYLIKPDGKKYLIGYVSDFEKQTVAPISETYLDVNIRLQLIGIVSDLLVSMEAGTLLQQTISLSAFANVDQLQVPLDFNYQIGS